MSPMIPPGQTIAQYEGRYPRLFESLRKAGWAPAKPTGLGQGLTWFDVSDHLPMNTFSLDFIAELEGKSIRHGRTEVCFFPSLAFKNLSMMDGYEVDVARIGREDAAPVADVGGKVLFVSADHRSVLIDQALSGFAQAVNPFALLNWQLYDGSAEEVEVVAAYQGLRIVQKLEGGGEDGEPARGWLGPASTTGSSGAFPNKGSRSSRRTSTILVGATLAFQQ